MSPQRRQPVAVPIPAVGFEEHTWRPTAMQGFTRRERDAVGRTYRSAVPAQIAVVDLVLPSELAADVEDAAATLVRLDAEAEHQPPTTTAVLLRSESASSSQIEHITASARAIAEAELTGAGSGNAMLIAANTKAMIDAINGIDIGDAVDAAAIERIQTTLLNQVTPKLVGWREEPVWIGGAGSTPVNADFVPPHHTAVRAAIDDLVQFVNRNDLPILPQVAIAHAQIETIHPFADGNGRTGRTLAQVMLRSKGLTRHVTAPISGAILVEKDRYIEALGSFRRGDAAPIIDVFNHAAIKASHYGRELSHRMLELREEWRTKITVRSDSAVWKIIDMLPAHPVIDAETVSKETGGNLRNAHRPLQTLVDADILLGGRHYKSRRYLYRAPDLLKLLDDYSTSFGRRQRI